MITPRKRIPNRHADRAGYTAYHIDRRMLEELALFKDRWVGLRDGIDPSSPRHVLARMVVHGLEGLLKVAKSFHAHHDYHTKKD